MSAIAKRSFDWDADVLNAEKTVLYVGFLPQQGVMTVYATQRPGSGTV